MDSPPPATPAVPRPRVRLGGVTFDAFTPDDVADTLVKGVISGHGGVIITPNVDILQHVVRRDERHLLDIADVLVADGMPIVWASRLAGTPLPARVTGSGLLYSLSETAARHDIPVYLLGARPGAASTAAATLAATYPGLDVAGTACPPVGFEKDDVVVQQIIEQIRASGAKLCFLAFGWPKQEILAVRLRESLPDVWFLCCGAAIDMAAGVVERANPTMQRLGLEWAHRLSKEPKRLFRRYVVDDIPFAAGLLARSMGTRFRNRRAARISEGGP